MRKAMTYLGIPEGFKKAIAGGLNIFFAAKDSHCGGKNHPGTTLSYPALTEKLVGFVRHVRMTNAVHIIPVEKLYAMDTAVWFDAASSSDSVFKMNAILKIKHQWCLISKFRL